MSRRARAYLEVDVFSENPLFGNPLAVVADAAGLDDATLQQFARWTNLSETCFLLAPTDARADYRVRIFTPQRELPFAGHPTLGSAWAWLSLGGSPRQAQGPIQECGIGLVSLRRDAQRLAFAAPALRRNKMDDALLARIVSALGLRRESVRASQVLVNGPQWLGVLVDSADTVLALEPDQRALATIGLVGVIGPAAFHNGDQRVYEVRAFAAADGIPEDPVTGSLNAGLAQWLIADGLAPDHYLVRQGSRLHRAGRVSLDAAGGQIWVGGAAHVCVEGKVYL